MGGDGALDDGGAFRYVGEATMARETHQSHIHC